MLGFYYQRIAFPTPNGITHPFPVNLSCRVALIGNGNDSGVMHHFGNDNHIAGRLQNF